MFKKLFQRNSPAAENPASPQDGAAKAPKASKAGKGGKLKGDVGKQYEELKRKGGPIPPELSAARGDMLRDLNNVPEAISLYEEAAVAYAADEMWDHVDALVKKIERLAQGATSETRLLSLQLYLGRQDYPAARRLLQELATALLPSDGIRIERMIHAVDSDTLVDSEVEVSLAETLIALARPERALERLQRARIRAQREGKPDRIARIDAKISQFSDLSATRSAAPQSPAPTSSARVAPQPEQTPPPPLLGETEEEDSFFFVPTPPERPLEKSAPEAPPRISERAERRLSAPEPEPEVKGPDIPRALPEVREAEPSRTLPELPSWAGLELPSLDLPPLGDNWSSAPQAEAPPALEAPASLPVEAEASFFPPVSPAEAPSSLPEAEAPVAPAAADPEALEESESERAASGYLDPAQLIEKEEERYPGGTRFVGEDPTQGAQTEEEQVQQLVRKLREGIRAVVPENEANSHYQMGLNFMTMELWDEAIESLQTAFRAPSYRRIAAEALAESFLERGDAVLARGAIRLALEGGSSEEAPPLGLLYWQGRAEEALGSKEEARRSYEQVAVFDTRFRDVMDRLRGLAA